jgi:hypothetical protein
MKGIITKKHRIFYLFSKIYEYEIQLENKKEKIHVVLPESIAKFEVGNKIDFEIREVKD